jgi:hypothetical protein
LHLLLLMPLLLLLLLPLLLLLLLLLLPVLLLLPYTQTGLAVTWVGSMRGSATTLRRPSTA